MTLAIYTQIWGIDSATPRYACQGHSRAANWAQLSTECFHSSVNALFQFPATYAEAAKYIQALRDQSLFQTHLSSLVQRR